MPQCHSSEYDPPVPYHGLQLCRAALFLRRESAVGLLATLRQNNGPKRVFFVREEQPQSHSCEWLKSGSLKGLVTYTV